MKKFSALALAVALAALSLLAPTRDLSAARMTKDERLAKRVTRLKQLLESERSNVRAKSAEMLGKLGVTDAGPLIQKLLADSEAIVKQAAITALGTLKCADAVDDIVKFLEDGKVGIQRAAIDALGMIGSEKAVKPLMDLAAKIKEETLYVPLGVALGKIGDKKAGPTLYKIYELTKDNADKCTVAAALGRLNGEAAVKLLDDLHKDSDMRVKYAALWAAGTMNNQAGYDWLVKKMSRILSLVTPYDAESGVRDAYSTAVGKMRDPKLLKAMLKEGEKDPKDLVMILHGLGRSGVSDIYDDLKNYLGSSEEEVELAAIEAVGLVHNQKGVKTLLDNLKKNSFQVRVASIIALGELTPDEAIDPLIELLKKDDWRIRFVTANSLLKIRSEDIVPPLISCLTTSAEWLQKELAVMLRDITGKDIGADPPSWDQFWAANKDKFEVQYEEDLMASNQTMTFYGVEINSNKVLFVLDRSGSMALPASEWEDTIATEAGGTKDTGDDIAPKDPKAAGKKKKGGKGRMSKEEVLKIELAKTVKILKPSINFNIIQYSTDHQLWQKDKLLVPATDANKAECLKYVEKMSPGGGTAIYDALKVAFIMAAGSIDGKDAELEKLKNPKFELAVDTIFLETDGTPMGGEIADPAKILEAVQKWNQLGRIRIHAVGIGEGQNVDFLRKLASQNGGKYSQN